MKISFSKAGPAKSGALAFPWFEDEGLAKAGAVFDKSIGGAIARAAKASPGFTGKPGQQIVLLAPAGVKNSRILVVGVGKRDDFDSLAAEKFGGGAVGALARSGEKTLCLVLDGAATKAGGPVEAAIRAAYGAKLRGYAFDKYRTTLKPEQRVSLEHISVATAASAAKTAFGDLEKTAAGVFLTRDLVSEPPNILYPGEFAKRCEALSELGLNVEILGEKQMQKLGMNALLGVGQGSARDSYLVVMHWRGRKDGRAPVALVGKGVTFDTGGISLKPGLGMEEMKWDMGGAGAVTGVMAALAGRGAKVNAIGVLGLVENMPDGAAQRPGDVVTTMSGQTVEILNTDAEGRLVLADALHYANTKFKPSAIIDLATLTGAVIDSLGHEYGGLFSNDDALAEALRKAGAAEGEPLWRLPMGAAYDEMIDSPIADMKNIGSKWAGSITAAQFLKRFVGDTPWAHLDIAGMAWVEKDKPTTPKGGAGYGVRLLDRWLRDNHEDNA